MTHSKYITDINNLQNRLEKYRFQTETKLSQTDISEKIFLSSNVKFL